MLVMDTRIPDTPIAGAPLTEAALCAWRGAAAPGDAITDYRGTLSRSRCPQLALLSQEERVNLARLAARAWKLAEAGLAHLVQRRHGFEDFSYVLVARRRPRRIANGVLPRILAEAA